MNGKLQGIVIGTLNLDADGHTIGIRYFEVRNDKVAHRKFNTLDEAALACVENTGRKLKEDVKFKKLQSAIIEEAEELRE